ncbi:MAG: trpD [Alphaproteobacteria bacterium]|nr:trpD [Alphaproteobacteria bacterium]
MNPTNPTETEAEEKAPPAVEEAIDRLCAGEDLDVEQAEALFAAIVDGTLDEAPLAGFLVALKAKGEAAAELIGAARALRAAAEPFPRPDILFADTCGTGGDRSGTINVSTAVAFAAAACGLPVVKHGNRSITSRCGSADVLERLGARIDLPALEARRVLDASGVCFLFAPQYHPGMRHAGPVRRALRVRTIFNMLGPCLNPAAPPVQLVGVADPRLIEPIARTLQNLGCGSALVVHGGGLDEIALHTETMAMRVRDGTIEALTITPEQAGLPRASIEPLAGGDPEENARRLRAVLGGTGSEAERGMVAINTGALLMTAGLADDLRTGTQAAMGVLDDGRALARLDAFVAASRG